MQRLPSEADFGRARDYLRTRLEPAYLDARVRAEIAHERWAARVPDSRPRRFSDWIVSPTVVAIALKLVGLYERARRNALDIGIQYNDLPVRDLPHAFVGYRLLQLSDLHIDMNEAFAPALSACLERLDLAYDSAVLTGDYRFRLHGSVEETLHGLSRIVPQLHNAFAILGNHDSIRLVEPIERLGARMLMNEAIALTRDASRLWLVGVDDPAQHRDGNLRTALSAVPNGEATVLLAHNPEFHTLAAKARLGAMLSGHTHGGQICLPGQIPLIYDADCPRRLASGAWSIDGLPGYTSVGAGSSIADVRLNCRPEITLHTLHCA